MPPITGAAHTAAEIKSSLTTEEKQEFHQMWTGLCLEPIQIWDHYTSCTEPRGHKKHHHSCNTETINRYHQLRAKLSAHLAGKLEKR